MLDIGITGDLRSCYLHLLLTLQVILLHYHTYYRTYIYRRFMICSAIFYLFIHLFIIFIYIWFKILKTSLNKLIQSNKKSIYKRKL